MRRESCIILALSVILHKWCYPYRKRVHFTAVLQIRLADIPRVFGTGRSATDLSHSLWSLKARRELRAVVAGAEVEQVVRRRRQRRVQRRGLQQALEHAAGATVLQALVRRQRVLRPVPPVAELAHVQRVRLFVLVLEVSFQGIVTRECPAAVGTLLWLVDTACGGRWHTEGRYCWKHKRTSFTLSIITHKTG